MLTFRTSITFAVMTFIIALTGLYGPRLRTPSGFEVVMNTNHHLSKPAMVGKLDTTGTFDVVWQSISPIKASVWSRYLSDSVKRVANWTYPWVCGGCTELTYKD